MDNQHEHRFWPIGGELACACGASAPDTRTPARREADRRAATAATVERHEAEWVRRARARSLPVRVAYRG